MTSNLVFEAMLKQGVIKQQRPLPNKIGAFGVAEPASGGMDTCEIVVASPERGTAEVATDFLVDEYTCISLNLEDLNCFEVVERQYQHWGVTFENCVALQPSNPAFPTQFGTTVLMGAPKKGFMEATFLRPVRLVSSYVTSSQRTVIAAYDRDRQLLAQAEIPGSNLAGDENALHPNMLLSLRAPNIYQITFCAFNGQFTIDGFTFIV